MDDFDFTARHRAGQDTSPGRATGKRDTGAQPGNQGNSIGARPTPAQARGAAAEALAAEHLAAQGLRLIARNVRCRGGEVDLICLDRSHVVFVEVRLRTSTRFGGAAASITVTYSAGRCSV